MPGCATWQYWLHAWWDQRATTALASHPTNPSHTQTHILTYLQTMASAAPTTTTAAAAGGGAVDLPVNAKAVKAAADAAGQKGLMNKVFSSVPIASLPRPKAGGVVVIPSGRWVDLGDWCVLLLSAQLTTPVLPPTDATIKEAVAILTKHDILAAPVRDVDCKLASPSWSDLYGACSICNANQLCGAHPLLLTQWLQLPWTLRHD